MRAPWEKMSAQGVIIHTSYNPTENIDNRWEHWKTSKIIWYHPENNWGPIIDDLVQLEEDFNSRKTSSENSPKTSENNWEHRKTPKIIWYHPENNWGPLIDDLVHFEEDFNSQTEMWSGGPVRLSQTSPIPRSPSGDKKVYHCRWWRWWLISAMVSDGGIVGSSWMVFFCT